MEICGHRYFDRLGSRDIQMATRVGCGLVVELDWSHSIAHPLKPPIRWKYLGDISYRIRIIALLSQISLPWQQGSVRVKFCWQY